MRHNIPCYACRIELEKLELKKKTWILVVLARLLIFLGILVNYYLGRS